MKEDVSCTPGCFFPQQNQRHKWQTGPPCSWKGKTFLNTVLCLRITKNSHTSKWLIETGSWYSFHRCHVVGIPLINRIATFRHQSHFQSQRQVYLFSTQLLWQRIEKTNPQLQFKSWRSFLLLLFFCLFFNFPLQMACFVLFYFVSSTKGNDSCSNRLHSQYRKSFYTAAAKYTIDTEWFTPNKRGGSFLLNEEIVKDAYGLLLEFILCSTRLCRFDHH